MAVVGRLRPRARWYNANLCRAVRIAFPRGSHLAVRAAWYSTRSSSLHGPPSPQQCAMAQAQTPEHVRDDRPRRAACRQCRGRNQRTAHCEGQWLRVIGHAQTRVLRGASQRNAHDVVPPARGCIVRACSARCAYKSPSLHRPRDSRWRPSHTQHGSRQERSGVCVTCFDASAH